MSSSLSQAGLDGQRNKIHSEDSDITSTEQLIGTIINVYGEYMRFIAMIMVIHIVMKAVMRIIGELIVLFPKRVSRGACQSTEAIINLKKPSVMVQEPVAKQLRKIGEHLVLLVVQYSIIYVFCCMINVYVYLAYRGSLLGLCQQRTVVSKTDEDSQQLNSSGADLKDGIRRNNEILNLTPREDVTRAERMLYVQEKEDIVEVLKSFTIATGHNQDQGYVDPNFPE